MQGKLNNLRTNTRCFNTHITHVTHGLKYIVPYFKGPVHYLLIKQFVVWSAKLKTVKTPFTVPCRSMCCHQMHCFMKKTNKDYLYSTVKARKQKKTHLRS